MSKNDEDTWFETKAYVRPILWDYRKDLIEERERMRKEIIDVPFLLKKSENQNENKKENKLNSRLNEEDIKEIKKCLKKILDLLS